MNVKWFGESKGEAGEKATLKLVKLVYVEHLPNFM
jgi:hypothetical protein